jgi:hypothetical protein
MTAWQLHATEPEVRPQGTGDDNIWEGVIRPRPDQLYPGVKVANCPGKDAAMGVIGRELRQHWPEVAA